MATLEQDDIDAIAHAVIGRLQALVAGAQRPAPGERPTLEQCLVGAAYTAYGEVDKSRDGDAQSGELAYTLPDTGLLPIVFDQDDVDRPDYRHRIQ